MASSAELTLAVTPHSAFFVLSTAGYLHEYPSSDTSLDKPHLSLYLPHCTLGPMPSAAGNKNGRFKFTLEGRQSATSGTFKGSLKMQHKELGRTYSARSWEELRAWWTELEKVRWAELDPCAAPPDPSVCAQFTKGSAGALAVEQGPAPLAVQRAGLPAETEEEAAHAGALTTDEEMGGSSDEEFEEAETSLGAAGVAARKEGSQEKVRCAGRTHALTSGRD